jgi:hypothetical protein
MTSFLRALQSGRLIRLFLALLAESENRSIGSPVKLRKTNPQSEDFAGKL